MNEHENRADFDIDEAETTMRAFETPNPWLRKLFDMPKYGVVPASTPGLLRELSVDPEEKLLAAIKCEHGRMRRGYLLATTGWLRWVRTFPGRADDMWEYSYKLDYQGMSLTKAVLVLGTGDQFQTFRTRAKPFYEMYRVIQQAMIWESQNADQKIVEAAEAASTTSQGPSLTDELMKLVELHTAGVLSDDEFAAAKNHLLA